MRDNKDGSLYNDKHIVKHANFVYATSGKRILNHLTFTGRITALIMTKNVFLNFLKIKFLKDHI